MSAPARARRACTACPARAAAPGALRLDQLVGPHAAEIAAIQSQIDDDVETHLYLADYRSLYVGQLGEVTAVQPVRHAPGDRGRFIIILDVLQKYTALVRFRQAYQEL